MADAGLAVFQRVPDAFPQGFRDGNDDFGSQVPADHISTQRQGQPTGLLGPPFSQVLNKG